MLVMRNRDVPGVIGRVGTALGGAGINIASIQHRPAQERWRDQRASSTPFGST